MGNKTQYVSKGARRNVSKKILKVLKRERTELEKVTEQMAAFWRGKNVILTIPNPNPRETNKPFVRINAKEVWRKDKFIIKENTRELL